jgi:hypothetical protein
MAFVFVIVDFFLPASLFFFFVIFLYFILVLWTFQYTLDLDDYFKKK